MKPTIACDVTVRHLAPRLETPDVVRCRGTVDGTLMIQPTSVGERKRTEGSRVDWIRDGFIYKLIN
jgi:hypothetical protein